MLWGKKGNKTYSILLGIILLQTPVISLSSKQISLTNPKKSWVKFFEKITSLTKLDTFLETGTYFGNTTADASLYFPQVHTIELSPEFYQKAITRFANNPKISVHFGDSGEIIVKLLPVLASQKNSILFWLDGHHCGEGTALGDDYSPIIQELQHIKDNNIKNSIILIDDVRLFGTLLDGNRIERAGRIEYPLVETICTHLNNCGYTSVMVGDILFAYDKALNLSFSPVIHACTLSRLYDGKNFDSRQILNAEAIIAEAKGEELESFQELYVDFAQKRRSNWYNKSPHYNLWYGLTLKKAGKYQEAKEQFNEVIDLEYNHWRIFWYLAECDYQLNNFTDVKKAIDIVLAKNPDFEPACNLLNRLKSKA